MLRLIASVCVLTVAACQCQSSRLVPRGGDASNNDDPAAESATAPTDGASRPHTPLITVTPAFIDLGRQPIHASRRADFTVSAVSGDGALTVVSLDPRAAVQSISCANPLSAPATCGFSVLMTADVIGPMSAPIIVELRSASAASSVTVNVMAQGFALPARARLTASAPTFHVLRPGEAALDTRTIRNEGTAAALDLMFSATAATELAFDTDAVSDCPASLAPNQSCTLTTLLIPRSSAEPLGHFEARYRDDASGTIERTELRSYAALTRLLSAGSSLAIAHLDAIPDGDGYWAIMRAPLGFNYAIGLVREDASGVRRIGDPGADPSGVTRLSDAPSGTMPAIVRASNGDVMTAVHATQANVVELRRFANDGSARAGFAPLQIPVAGSGLNSDGVKLLQQPNARWVVAVKGHDTGYKPTVLHRFNDDGSPDDGSAMDSTPSDVFGSNGRVELGSPECSLFDLQQDTIGRLWVASGCAGGVRIVRLSSEGVHDSAFGVSGIATVSSPNATRVRLAVEPSGHLWLALSGTGFTTLLRRQPDGSADAAFAGSGAFSLSRYTVAHLLRLDDRMILVTSNAAQQELRAFTAAGLDTSFGSSGVVSLSLSAPWSDVSSAKAVDATHFLLTGRDGLSQRRAWVGRFDRDGVLSSSSAVTRGFHGIMPQSLSLAQRKSDGRVVVAAAMPDADTIYAYQQIIEATLDADLPREAPVSAHRTPARSFHRVLATPSGRLFDVWYDYADAHVDFLDAAAAPMTTIGTGGSVTLHSVVDGYWQTPTALSRDEARLVLSLRQPATVGGALDTFALQCLQAHTGVECADFGTDGLVQLGTRYPKVVRATDDAGALLLVYDTSVAKYGLLRLDSAGSKVFERALDGTVADLFTMGGDIVMHEASSSTSAAAYVSVAADGTIAATPIAFTDLDRLTTHAGTATDFRGLGLGKDNKLRLRTAEDGAIQVTSSLRLGVGQAAVLAIDDGFVCALAYEQGIALFRC